MAMSEDRPTWLTYNTLRDERNRLLGEIDALKAQREIEHLRTDRVAKAEYERVCSLMDYVTTRAEQAEAQVRALMSERDSYKHIVDIRNRQLDKKEEEHAWLVETYETNLSNAEKEIERLRGLTPRDKNFAKKLLKALYERDEEVKRLRMQIMGPNTDYSAWQRAERRLAEAQREIEQARDRLLSILATPPAPAGDQ